MENANIEILPSAEIVSRVSWIGYVIPVLVTLITIAFIIASPLSIFFCLFPILFFVYKFLLLKSILLYVNDEGVWCYSGVFPWDKGHRGVKWRDLDEAVFNVGFISWAFKAYVITIKHRFTQGNEIKLTFMDKGDQAVMQINRKHQGIIESLSNE